MLQPGRKYSGGSGYRYGFNGQERDKENAGEGNSYTAEFWQYDPRIGRRWNLDPILKTWESPYATFHNNPIFFSDRNGDDPGGRAKEYAKKNKLKDYKIKDMKAGGGVSLSWFDSEKGIANTIYFRTQRSDIAPNNKIFTGGQYSAASLIDGIYRWTNVRNSVKNYFSNSDASLKGTYTCTPYGGFITDTKKESADRFLMYVDNSTEFHVDESQSSEFADYETFVVNQLLKNFVKGTGAENYIFPTNGVISSKFLGSDILNEALQRFNNGEKIDGTQMSFGLGELINDVSHRLTFYSITGFVGSGTITIKQTAKGLLIKIFNITSLTSGELFKNPNNDKKWPISLIRTENGQAFGNISQTFNLFIPK